VTLHLRFRFHFPGVLTQRHLASLLFTLLHTAYNLHPMLHCER
jgi:hypothetical protein